jgi:hypothetical protein
MDIYLQVPAGSQPPSIPCEGYFKAVVIIEQEVSTDWRNRTSEWLVASGCKYMMAWGKDCSLWDDAVDWACITGKLSLQDHAVTTWHEDESLEEVFYFAQHHANHIEGRLAKLIVIHISDTDKAREFEDLHKAAASE